MSRPARIPDALRARLALRGVVADDPLGALQALEARWGEEPALDAAVAALVGASDEAGAGEILSRLAARSTDKSVKKEIKRALYRLEQRGLWHAPDAPPPPAARDLLGPSEDEPEAWLSSIDPSGSRLLWMARRTSAGMVSLSALINETVGLQEFYAGETTRKALRHAQRDLTEKSGIQLVDAPWQHVDALLGHASEIARDQSKAASVARARREIAPHRPSAPPRPPVDALIDRAAAAADPSVLAESAAALAERELGGWLLPRNWVEPALGGIDDAQGSVVIVSPQQREERLRDSLQQAASSVFDTEGRRELYATRLDETAYLLAKRGRVEPARALVAAAEATRGGRPIAEIPVLAQVAARSLALAMQIRAEQTREETSSSLVLTPQQALEEQRRLATRRGR